MSTNFDYNKRQGAHSSANSGILGSHDEYLRRQLHKQNRAEDEKHGSDAKEARRELRMNSRRYNTPVRETRQVRMSKHWHQKLKELASQEEITMSKLVDRMCKAFLQNNRNL